MGKAYNLAERFRAHFGGEGCFYRAPGRVNLIGEHIDYNDGFVLPAAIDFDCWLAVSPRPDASLILRSDDFDQTWRTAGTACEAIAGSARFGRPL